MRKTVRNIAEWVENGEVGILHVSTSLTGAVSKLRKTRQSVTLQVYHKACCDIEC
jgi:hypothetical protein